MNTVKTQRPTHLHSGNILISTVVTVFILVVTAYMLSWVYHPTINTLKIKSVFLTEIADKVNPKPKEKFIFIVLLFALPAICFFSLKLSQWIAARTSLAVYHKVVTILIGLLCWALLYIILKFNIALLLGWPLILNPIALVASFGIAYLIYKIIFRNKRVFPKNILHFAKKYITPLTALLVILIPCLAFRVASIALVDETKVRWGTDFEAVFYNVSQIVAGKTVLIDLPAQYGLYGEILYPIFKVFHLSVFNFTVIMTSLQIIGLLCVYQLLTHLIKSHLLILCCIICVCMTTSWLMVNGLANAPYYQYFPIRTIFPMVSSLLFLFLIKQKSLPLSSVVYFSIFCALATLWNTDSGIPIFGALLGYTLSFTIFPSKHVTRKMSLGRGCIIVGIFLSTITVFLLYLYVKAGYQSLNVDWLFKYQKIFYQSGYMMMPLHTDLNAWQIIYYLYVVALTIAISHWIKNTRTISSDMYFILSILGFGLFMYFEGRSHAFNLINTLWPAFIIMFMLTEKIIRLTKKELTCPRFVAFSIIIICYTTYIVSDFIYKMPAVISYGIGNWKTIVFPSITREQRNLDFIKQHYNNTSIVIISPIQSIYYAAINRPSAISGPGRIEIMLKSDFDYFASQLAQARSDVVFLQLNNSYINTQKYLPYLKRYTMRSVSTDGLAYYVRKE